MPNIALLFYSGFLVLKATLLHVCFCFFCHVCRLRLLVNGRSSGMHRNASFSSSSIPVLMYGASVSHCGSQRHMETSHTRSACELLTFDL